MKTKSMQSFRCEGCGHSLLSRTKNGPRQCNECNGRTFQAIDRETYDAYKEKTKPTPTTPRPDAMVKHLEKEVDKEIIPTKVPQTQNPGPGLSDLEGFDASIHNDRVRDYQSRYLDFKERELESRMRRLEGGGNNGNSEVARLKEKVQQMETDKLRSDFASQQQATQNELRRLTDVLSRPGGKSDLDVLFLGLEKFGINPLTSGDGDVDTQLLKNQGAFVKDAMGIVKDRMKSMDKGISRIADVWEAKVMEKEKAKIRAEARIHPDGTPPTTWSDEGPPEAMTPEEMERLAKASDILLEAVEAETPTDTRKARYYTCSECNGKSHLHTSKIGKEHIKYLMVG